MQNNKLYSRRTFLALIGTGSVALVGGYLHAHHSLFSLIEKPDRDVPFIHSEPGRLSAENRAILWKLFLDIGFEWKLITPSEVEIRRSVFDQFIDVKAEQAPSYLGEYENAIAVLDQSLSFSMNLASRVGHCRQYVIKEFAELHMISGGFKHFGYQNYFGHPGGSLTGHPYR